MTARSPRLLRCCTLLGLGLLAAVARPAHGQTLSLADALRRAETAGYVNRIAEADARARAGAAALPLRGILPTVRVEGGYVRTTDPLAAFGSTLRQRTVTVDAFAPDRLNDPTAIGNLGSALVV